jgi:ornithine carbamoyltransferase
MVAAPRHFLDIADFASADLKAMIASARAMKVARKGMPKGAREAGEPLRGRILAMIFERPSTRTRVSFEAAMRQLGGDTLVISAGDMQLGRGETIADTARVLSRYVDAVMIRASQHAHLTELARHAGVPVISGLTDLSHPCQVMADVMTVEERKGPLARQTIAWVGDGNNVAASWIHAVARLGGKLRLGCPPSLSPPPQLLRWAGAEKADVQLVASAEAAVAGADCVVTDAWVSMHDQAAANRHNLLKSYQVDGRLMALAAKDAIFMHCLPAHRGEEVTGEVIDGPQSAVFDEAENRLHIQKSILLHCLSGHD